MRLPRELRASRPTGSQSRRLDEDVRTYWGVQAWTCQLCGDPIPPEVPRSHPLAWTKDHIIPVAQGGGNDLANLQPVHALCNKRKGDTPGPPVTQRHRARLRTSREW
jgi:5-methylcytosine-specific restriction endonuclease McrA